MATDHIKPLGIGASVPWRSPKVTVVDLDAGEQSNAIAGKRELVAREGARLLVAWAGQWKVMCTEDLDLEQAREKLA